jgi:hypothetical protein
MHNLNYTSKTMEYKIEKKLHLGLREQKSLNTTGLDRGSSHPCVSLSIISSIEFSV